MLVLYVFFKLIQRLLPANNTFINHGGWYFNDKFIIRSICTVFCSLTNADGSIEIKFISEHKIKYN